MFQFIVFARVLIVQATLSGTYYPQVPTISRAVATIIGGTATIPTATYATISVAPSLGLTLSDADNVVIDLGNAASASVQGGPIYLDAPMGGSTVTMIADSGSANLGGADTRGDINFVGQVDDARIYAYSGAEVRMDGSLYQAIIEDNARGTAYGSTIKCEAYFVSVFPSITQSSNGPYLNDR